MKVNVCALAVIIGALAPALLAADRTAQENFKKHCVDCHGSDGKAKTRLGRKSGAKDLTDKAEMTKLSDDEVFKTIKFGRKNKQGEQKMDPFGEDLSDAEIRELVTYVRTFAK
jgi:mono/diheme cytochrome c family protein